MRIDAAPHTSNLHAAPRRVGDDGFPVIEGVTHKYTTVNGVRYHYAEAGRGEPLLLIHGFPQNWYMWRHMIPELSKHYRVIAPDMRGAGWTEAPAGGYAKVELSHEIAAFMDAVGAPKARVMGHDWGGYIGFMLALQHPEKVSQYVALNIATPWPTATALPDAWRMAYHPLLATPVVGAALLRSPNFVKTMLSGAAARPVWSEQDYQMFTQPYKNRAHSAAGSAMYRTFLTKELAPWVKSAHDATPLATPTLLLVGAHDPVITPRVIAGYERHSENMRAEFIQGAGHFLPEERPDVVLDRALRFFGTSRATPATP